MLGNPVDETPLKPFYKSSHFWIAVGLGAVGAAMPFLPHWLQLFLGPLIATLGGANAVSARAVTSTGIVLQAKDATTAPAGD